MSETGDTSGRLRPHPEERFRARQHLLDLDAAAAKLAAEPLGANVTHRQETLYKAGPVTVALFLLEQGASMPQHVAEGVVTVQVLTGRIRMDVEGQVHHLGAGQLLVMAPGVRHDVQAEASSRMLLTVSLDKA